MSGARVGSPSRVALLPLACLALLACRSPASGDGPEDAMASPQASAMPAPLASPQAPPSAAPVVMPEGGPPPVALRGDVALGPDTLARETIGYTLSAVMRPSDVPGPPKAPEVNAAGLEAARKKTELRLAIDLSPSRMRLALVGSGWVLPPDTELRSRADHYGHVVVWPGGLMYRPLAPGALRALFGERRFDVAPITAASLVARDDVGKRLGIRTRTAEVSTRAAKATFEIGRLPDLGEGGTLLCRVLLDLMNAPPGTPLCADGELPMRAELRWTARGSLSFELTGVLKKADMPTTTLLVPPAAAVYAATPLTPSGVQLDLSPQELAALRTGPVDVPPPAHGGSESGLVIANATDQVRLLLVDGIPVAWAAPGAKDIVPGLHRGRYVGQWRTFLGESFEAPFTLIVPGTAAVGAPDAGK
ncbi:MAG: hypothetical protein JWP97_5516 [Labilithrix sp.]|nr:hypothetical protein [Labilithrix sp.]